MAMKEPPLKIKSIFSAPLNFFGILKAPLKIKKQSETTFSAPLIFFGVFKAPLKVKKQNKCPP